MIEIRDGWRSVRPYLTEDVAERARADGARTNLTGLALEAFVQARQLDSALRMYQRVPRPPAPPRRRRRPYTTATTSTTRSDGWRWWRTLSAPSRPATPRECGPGSAELHVAPTGRNPSPPARTARGPWPAARSTK
ncbi:DUF6545 domain-containing protein [Gandjariella thermophila]|uniref:DUF6545 domain-containing protein n=1 Tax=Gandjariella thermophila TaxID=1931992 RepID=UPI00353112F6